MHQRREVVQGGRVVPPPLLLDRLVVGVVEDQAGDAALHAGQQRELAGGAGDGQLEAGGEGGVQGVVVAVDP